MAFGIAHIDTGKAFRGGQDLLLSLARGLQRRGHEQLIICPAESPLAKRASAEGLEVMALTRFHPLRREIGRRKFEVAHAHDARAQTLSFLASAGLPIVRVASRQVAFAPRHPLLHQWKYSWTCHGIIANSEAVRKVLITAGIPAAKIEVITPGVEMPAQLPSSEQRATARARWGFSDSDFVVGHVGAFTPEKGQGVAIDAAAILIRALPQARILLAGDGPMRPLNSVPPIVRLPGHVENPDEVYAALDLYIMPSLSEGWGLTALRAMAFGIPVIASNVGGLPEFVEPGRSGWLVPPGSPEALADAIGQAASDAERLREFGRHARERAASFSMERTVEKTEAFYQRLLMLEKG